MYVLAIDLCMLKKTDMKPNYVNTISDLQKHRRNNSCPKTAELSVASGILAKRLKSLLLICTGDKPNRCCTCWKSFPVDSLLKIYSRNHTGKEQYKCQKSLTQGSRMTAHMINHLNVNYVRHHLLTVVL